MLVVGFLAGLFGLGLGWFIVNLIWAFIYNKMYTNKLIEAGYKLADTPEKNQAARIALSVGEQAVISRS